MIVLISPLGLMYGTRGEKSAAIFKRHGWRVTSPEERSRYWMEQFAKRWGLKMPEKA